MKNLIYLSIIGFLFAACGGGSDDPVSPPVVNTAPVVPVITAPVDNKLCLDNIVSFQWNESTDPEKDAVRYQIQVAKDNAFSQMITSLDYASNPTNIALEKNTAYYWRVKATDSKGLSSAYTTTYKFYTAGDAVVNHLPFAPTLLEPVSNSIVNNTTVSLKWYGGVDVDPQDTVSYDVYLGTTNPPTEKVTTTYETSAIVTLEPTKQYFWKVVVKDDKGGETVGQIWKFKTN